MKTPIARTGPVALITEALEGPRSAYFGLAEGGKSRRPESYYRAADRYVSFDVSNNQILSCLSATGSSASRPTRS